MSRLPVASLYILARRLAVPVDFFFEGLDGLVSPQQRQTHAPLRSREARLIIEHFSGEHDDVSYRQGLRLIEAYWRIPNSADRHAVLKMVKHLAERDNMNLNR